jgi:hypothetical protein
MLADCSTSLHRCLQKLTVQYMYCALLLCSHGYLRTHLLLAVCCALCHVSIQVAVLEALH